MDLGHDLAPTVRAGQGEDVHGAPEGIRTGVDGRLAGVLAVEVHVRDVTPRGCTPRVGEASRVLAVSTHPRAVVAPAATS